LVAAVRAAVNQIDPVGLLALGCPDDEYEAEIADIVERLRQGQAPSPAMVRAVLDHWFGPEVAIADEAIKALAAAVRSAAGETSE
jgi:hypothetical protein